MATLETLNDGEPRVVSFGVEPVPLIRALAEGRLPEAPLPTGNFEIEVTPDESTNLVSESH